MSKRAGVLWLVGLVAGAGVLTSAGRAPAAHAQVAGSPVVGKLTWFGQSCFLLETAAGTRILMDPIPKGIGYPLPPGLKVDAVTVSHEHPDHNNVALATNRPKIFRGLTPDKKGWTRIDEKVKEVAVRSIAVYHDASRGAQRGLNAAFLFEVAGMRIVHLGDLGHLLSDDQLSALGSVDVVLIPVGGTFTLDAHQATRVVDQLHPRLLVVPMHFKTDAAAIKELVEVDPFLAGKPNVHRETGNTIPLKPLKGRPGTEVIVLDYK
jgi:L-ascorbate metabolism protein UlaG (beta-lactamase superfamily)